MIWRRRKTKRGAAERVKSSGRLAGADAGLPPELYERLVASLLFAGAVLLLVCIDRGGGAHFIRSLAASISVLALGGWYFVRFEPKALSDLRQLISLYLVGLTVVSVACVSRGHDLLPWMIPLPLAALFITIVFNPRVAIASSLVLTALTGTALDPDEKLPDLLLVLFGGAVAASLLATRVRKRSTLVSVGTLTGLFVGILQLALSLDSVGVETENLTEHLMELRIAAVVGQGVVAGFLLTGLLPAIEHLTGTVTDIRLLELSNQNEQPLLRRLLLVAPGTHHHSFVVGTLAEAAAKSIGAHALLCRVGAYYHDIGKMNKPEYFSENSHDAAERHKSLSPEMSTLIITAHPKDGLELADYYGLPDAIKPFIAEHHGTTAVEYFYRKAVEQRGDDQVTKDAYRYPGPKPQTRETAILMLADSVEATSRTLIEPTPSRLETLIRDITDSKIADNQFDDCPLTMRDIKRIQESFLQVLVGIYHRRPTYPRTSTAISTDDVFVQDLARSPQNPPVANPGQGGPP